MPISVRVLAAVMGASVISSHAEPINGTINADGKLSLTLGTEEWADFSIGAFDSGWQLALAKPDRTAVTSGRPGQTKPFLISMPGGPTIAGESLITMADDAIVARYAFVPRSAASLNSIHVSMDIPADAIGAGSWKIIGAGGPKNGTFSTAGGGAMLFSGEASSLEITTSKGAVLLAFLKPTHVLIQDNRQWDGNTFSVRMGAQGDARQMAAGQRTELEFKLSSPAGIRLDRDSPVTITAGAEWVPLKTELDIEPGSAADLSNQGFHDPPAGKHGWLLASPEGRFVFEKDRGTPRRFYGVNFSFSSQYLEHADADRVADRLRRQGYNTIRVHHFETELVGGQKDSVTPNAEKLDRLDYFLSACASRGIYITTDLYVSRHVPWKELGVDKPGNVEMNTFKLLIPVLPAAWDNWKAFARNLLGHHNPYRKCRYADDPAIAWLSMVNEGTYANFLSQLHDIPEWRAAWNAWLARRYPAQGALRAAWGKELRETEEPSSGSVAFPRGLDSSSPRSGDCVQFLAEMERDTLARMRAFLRDELGCRALLTNANAWTNFLAMQAARNGFDYVDDHFYVDHPHFIEQPWRLPSRCENRSPVSGGATGGRANAFTRIPGKPFTITEYNYAAPGRFRGVGGILTGALGAVQDWDGIWRYSYSHTREAALRPSALNYFDMVTDPMGQAAERASLCLFLRGDMRPVPAEVTVVSTEQEAFSIRPQKRIHPQWSWLAWLARVGTAAARHANDVPTDAIALPTGDDSMKFLGQRTAGAQAYALKDADMLSLLASRGVLKDDNFTDPPNRRFRCPTGEISIDGQNDLLIIDTPRTAGGYAPAGKTMAAHGGGLQITIEGSDATAWISSVDGKPIRESGRLLLSHLTDLQNTGIRYGERARQTLLAWGQLPHLVRNGTAKVTLKHSASNKLKVWALSNGGRRLAELPATRDDGGITFTADVAAFDQEHGAIILYEIAVE